MFKITWSCGISKVRFERVGDQSFFSLYVAGREIDYVLMISSC